MRRMLFRLALLSAALAGCSATPFQYRPVTEIPDGPGMLTGKEGAFVMNTDRHDEARSVASPPPASDQDEFLAFQAFRRWRETNRDSREYREFREWQAWKEFQAWKKSAQ